MNKVVPLEGFGGGGSSPLNFKVVGGTSAPSSPKENMIWVNTDTIEIPEYYFSVTQPESTTPGAVWILTSTSSTVEFNALKKCGIQVYPISAKQYIGGEWVDKIAKSYQNEQWVDWWTGNLYDNGDLVENITGGWTAKEYACGIGYTGNTLVKPNLTFNDTNISASLPSNGSGIIHITNLIDVSNFSTLRISCMASWGGGEARLCLWPNTDGKWDTNAAASLTFTKNATDVYELAIDNLSGNYYIGIGLYHDASITITSMKLL